MAQETALLMNLWVLIQTHYITCHCEQLSDEAILGRTGLPRPSGSQ